MLRENSLADINRDVVTRMSHAHHYSPVNLGELA